MPVLTPSELDSKVAEIVRRLRDALRPSEIYLFGSYVYGTPNDDSDLDFVVVVENSDLDAYGRDAIAYRALSGIRVPKDVMVYTRTEFGERAALPVSLERTVKAKGKIVNAA